jgi:hypothetical protein
MGGCSGACVADVQEPCSSALVAVTLCCPSTLCGHVVKYAKPGYTLCLLSAFVDEINLIF